MLRELQPGFAPPLYDQFTFQVGSPLTSEIPQFTNNVLDTVLSNGTSHFIQYLPATWKRSMILERYRWLVDELFKHSHLLDHNVTITPQTHTLIWTLEDKGR